MAISPYRPTTDLFRSFFEDAWPSAGMGGRVAGADMLRTPNADVRESKDDIQVMVELPGLSPDDIEINLENNLLTISGEKREVRQEDDRENRWHLTERRYGTFSRSFVLPRDVEQDAIRADFENGVLNVTIPKSERSKPRRIEIGGGSGSQRIETNSSNG